MTALESLYVTRLHFLPANKFWKALSPTFLEYGEEEELAARREHELNEQFMRSWDNAIFSIIFNTPNNTRSRKSVEQYLNQCEAKRKMKNATWPHNFPYSDILHVYLAMRMAEAVANTPYSDNPSDTEDGDNRMMRNLVELHYSKNIYDEVECVLDNKIKAVAKWMIDYIRTEAMPLVNRTLVHKYGKKAPDIPEYFPVKFKVYDTSGVTDYWHNPNMKTCTQITKRWLNPLANSTVADIAIGSAFTIFHEYIKNVHHVSTHMNLIDKLYKVFDYETNIYRALEEGVCNGAFHAVCQRIFNISIGDISKPVALRQKLPPPQTYLC